MGRARGVFLVRACVYVDASEGEIEGIGVADGEMEGAGESRAGQRPTITPLPMGRPRRREGEAQFSSWERLLSLTTHNLALITRPWRWDTICTLHRCHPVTPSDGNIPVTLPDY